MWQRGRAFACCVPGLIPSIAKKKNPGSSVLGLTNHSTSGPQPCYPRCRLCYLAGGLKGRSAELEHMPTVLALTEGSRQRPWTSHSAGPNVACPVVKELYAQLKSLLPWKKETCTWPRPVASGAAASPEKISCVILLISFWKHWKFWISSASGRY